MAINPDDTDKPFVARWNSLVTALLVEPSVKLVARQACDYGIMDGEGIYPGNQRLARQTGLTERTVREAWHFMRAADMAVRDSRSAWTGSQRTADAYSLNIPSSWRHYPVLGPHSARFTCQHCGKLFDPQPCNVFLTAKGAGGKPVPVTDADGAREVRWRLYKAVYCPAPREGAGCMQAWERKHGPWAKLDNTAAWEMFHKARDDEWPASLAIVALTRSPRRRRRRRIRSYVVVRDKTLGGTDFRYLADVTSGGTGSQFRVLAELTSGTGTHLR